MKDLFGPNGKFDYIESPYSQDFKFSNMQNPCRGIVYQESRQSFVYLGHHESLAEILDSCEHESIHCSIRHNLKEEDDHLRMDIDQEHELMRFFKYAKDDLIF